MDNQELTIDIKYFVDDLKPVCKVDGKKSDWIDLRCGEDVTMKAGDYRLIRLGVGMKLPDGYEANVVPRSSTLEKFGIIQGNHFGVIDGDYCGEEDEWKFPAYALRDTVIHKNDRICQFRITKRMDNVKLNKIEHLRAISRGGFGSTGIN